MEKDITTEQEISSKLLGAIEAKQQAERQAPAEQQAAASEASERHLNPFQIKSSK